MAITDFESGFDKTWQAPLAIITGVGLFLMMLQGLNLINDGRIQTGLQVLAPAMIFMLLFLFGYVVAALAHIQDADNVFLRINNDTGPQMALTFFIGVFAWWGVIVSKSSGFLGSIVADLPVMPVASVLSSAAGGLTAPQYMFVNGVMAPYVEELFFMFALPAIGFFTLGKIGLKNRVVRMLIVIPVTSVLFALFHVSQPAFSAFWISAFVFSVVIRGAVFLDLTADIIPGFAALSSFAIGAHMINNVYQLGGVVKFFTVLSQDIVLFALVAGFVAVNVLWAVQGILQIRARG